MANLLKISRNSYPFLRLSTFYEHEFQFGAIDPFQTTSRTYCAIE